MIVVLELSVGCSWLISRLSWLKRLPIGQPIMGIVVGLKVSSARKIYSFCLKRLYILSENELVLKIQFGAKFLTLWYTESDILKCVAENESKF
jgi:hypothetical protein